MRVFTLALVLLCGGVARGEWLVDGPWVDDVERSRSYSSTEKLGVKFAVDQPTIIESIDGRIYLQRDSQDVPSGQGNLQWAIYSNGTDNWPSQRLMSQSFYTPESPYGERHDDWRGIYDLGWTLDAGEYWAVLEGVDGVYSEGGILGTHGNGIPPAYNFANYELRWAPGDVGPPWYEWRSTADYSYPNLGIRVAGHAVPEPSSLTLVGAAIAALAFKRKSHGCKCHTHGLSAIACQ